MNSDLTYIVASCVQTLYNIEIQIERKKCIVSHVFKINDLHF